MYIICIYIILYNYIWCYFQPPWTWDWWFTNSKCKTSPLRAEPFDPQLSMGPDQCLSVLLSAVGTTENYVIGHNRTCLYSSRVVHPNFTPQAVDLDQPLQCIFAEGHEANERPNQSNESNLSYWLAIAFHVSLRTKLWKTKGSSWVCNSFHSTLRVSQRWYWHKHCRNLHNNFFSLRRSREDQV